MLVTEGKSAKTAAHTSSRQCVEGANAGGRASNDRKPAIRGGKVVVRYPTQPPSLLSTKLS
jgi:hypothetical protein